MPQHSNNPPYLSPSAFQNFINITEMYLPEYIDASVLTKLGIPASNVYALVSGLKSLKIVDENGKVKDSRSVAYMSKPDRRVETLGKIAQEAYPELLSIETSRSANVNEIQTYYLSKGIKPTIALKAARFFVWLREEAKLGASNALLSATSPQQDNVLEEISRTNSVREPERSSKRYEEELLRILLDNLRESKQLPPAEILAEIRKLIAVVEGFDTS